ncbi:MAG: rRNA maturation RNase YbeY [Enterobacterales bacterium]
MIILNFQCYCKNKRNLPKKSLILLWLNFILPFFRKNSEVTIRLVDKCEMHFINMKFSNKNYPTNILSFPFIANKKVKSSFIGDIVICKSIVEKEAKYHNKNLQSHWAHMIIHGILHLIGFNHILENDAIHMEKLEIFFMKTFGYENPYIY